jgi:hypothetical protein
VDLALDATLHSILAESRVEVCPSLLGPGPQLTLTTPDELLTTGRYEGLPLPSSRELLALRIRFLQLHRLLLLPRPLSTLQERHPHFRREGKPGGQHSVLGLWELGRVDVDGRAYLRNNGRAWGSGEEETTGYEGRYVRTGSQGHRLWRVVVCKESFVGR